MHRFFICLGVVIVACTSPNNKPDTTLADASDTSVHRETSNFLPVIDTFTTDKAILNIRTAFQKINRMKLQSQVFKWTADNCNDEGTATYYFDAQNKIVKVVETGAIGDGSWTTAYYYQNGHFIFSLDTRVGGPAMGPSITTTTRTYVYNDKVIRMLEGDTYLSLTDSILTPASREYSILSAYKSKNFGLAFCQ